MTLTLRRPEEFRAAHNELVHAMGVAHHRTLEALERHWPVVVEALVACSISAVPPLPVTEPDPDPHPVAECERALTMLRGALRHVEQTREFLTAAVDAIEDTRSAKNEPLPALIALMNPGPWRERVLTALRVALPYTEGSYLERAMMDRALIQEALAVLGGK